MNKIVINEKTIILTIGISNCGKSYFSTNKLIPALKAQGANVKYLSSDETRRELANDPSLHKHSPRGQELSQQAFNILENLLDNYTQYPVNTDVVVIDAMNISKEGRNFIFKTAYKNNYRLVGFLFDYKNKEDYFKYSDGLNSTLINNMYKTFKEHTLKDIKRSDFESLYTVNSLNFDNLEFEYKSNSPKQANLNLHTYDKFCIVGDIHGCYDEFIKAVTDDKGISYDESTGKLTVIDPTKYHHHILVGDYVDKGPKIKEVIKFLYNNKDFFTIVIGNHESFIYKFLKGELGSYEKNETIIKSYFNTIDLIKDDEEYKKMFFDLFERSYEFVEYEHFIVTHAPCDVKYLGKFDSKSAKAQRNLSYPKRADYKSDEEYISEKEKAFEFIMEQAHILHPFHFFGHISVKDTFKHKNKFNIDTGCVSGNKLTVALFNIGQKMPFFKSYSSQQPMKESLNMLFSLKKKDVDFSLLEYEEKRRIKFAAENKLNFVSGTMSPVDKDVVLNDLESLRKGIEYYRDNKVGKIIIQPKFMGSRGNLLLHKNHLEKTQLFSRQGFLVKSDRLTGNYNLPVLIRDLQFKYNDLFNKLDAEYILFDGELLPWTAMGKGLIDKDFIIPYEASKSEFDFLKEEGFFEEIDSLNKKFTNVDVKELKPHEVSILKAHNEFKSELQTAEQIVEDTEDYMKQLSYFTAETDLEFKPFSILKVFKNDGTEENYISENHSNIDIFDMISIEPSLIVDFETLAFTWRNVPFEINKQTNQCADFETLMFVINNFWDYIAEENHMEGVVIKPEFTYKHGVAPYLKCRNKGYLKLVYGMDYLSIAQKYKNLIDKKNIKNKINTSIKEWLLGKKLLDIKRKDISIDNLEWVSLIYQLITEQEGEKNLDPRL